MSVNLPTQRTPYRQALEALDKNDAGGPLLQAYSQLVAAEVSSRTGGAVSAAQQEQTLQSFGDSLGKVLLRTAEADYRSPDAANVQAALDAIGGEPVKDAYRHLLEEMRVTGNVAAAQQHLLTLNEETVRQAGNNSNLSQSVQAEATYLMEEARGIKPVSLMERLSLGRSDSTPGAKR